MADWRPRWLALGLMAGSATGLSACGQSAAATGASDPVSVVSSYMKDVQGGNKDGGQLFLINHPEAQEVLSGATPASVYMSSHKGTQWQVVAVPWVAPGSTAQPAPMKSACLIGKPPPSQVCLITIQVGAGDSSAYFRFAVEDRYGPNRIISVDRVKNANDLLPTGKEAHQET